METVYLSLGSNLGDRLANMQAAISHLSGILQKIKASTLYTAEPVGMSPDSPWFLNAVVMGETELAPEALLAACTSIETKMGRVRTSAAANPFDVATEATAATPKDRTLDIDILFYGHRVIEMPNLTIPHPHIAERQFMLVPMAELSPKYMHPVLKKTIWELLAECADTAQVEKFYGKIFGL